MPVVLTCTCYSTRFFIHLLNLFDERRFSSKFPFPLLLRRPHLFMFILRLLFGLTQWFISIYVKENLHIFGRLFALGLGSTVVLEIYGWTTELMEFELKFFFATLIPVAACLLLLMYSIHPEQSTTNEKTDV
jgi:hypothetical protein